MDKTTHEGCSNDDGGGLCRGWHILHKSSGDRYNVSMLTEDWQGGVLMTIEEILAGESKNVEFKEELPEKGIKYIKSVVAFANGNGGKIIFGVEDETRKVIGINRDDVFKIMDAIANAISDSCEPAIIPDITLQTIENKTIIVVEITPGRQRPYYIKSMGRDAGTYVRVSGTTRRADEYMVKELMFEGSNRSYDRQLCMDLNVTDKDVDVLCKTMKEQAAINARDDAQRLSIKDVTRQQLLSWGVLIEQDGVDYPTNAYAILTGSGDMHITMQCAVFKGTTKDIFVDRREYTGPIWEQMDEAYQFVLRNIHLGAAIEGIYRNDIYEIPPAVIRELIINAAVHRSYLDHGNIQIALYDDRLEITSPGKLPMGQTIERMKEGYSKIRNEALANAFSYMNLVEHWGSGIQRIMRRLNEANLEEPEFIGGDVDLRINVYRTQNSANGAKLGTNGAKLGTNGTKLGTNYIELVKLVEHNSTATQAWYAEQLGVSRRTVIRLFAELQELGILEQQGTRRKVKWAVIKKIDVDDQ